MEAALRGVGGAQEALERRLAVVEVHQREVHEALAGMEGEAERLYREERPLQDDDTRRAQRRAACRAAQRT